MLKDSEKMNSLTLSLMNQKCLNKLLEKRLIKLPEPKHPEEIRTFDPENCKYYRIISRPIEKCKTFKG